MQNKKGIENKHKLFYKHNLIYRTKDKDYLTTPAILIAVYCEKNGLSLEEFHKMYRIDIIANRINDIANAPEDFIEEICKDKQKDVPSFLLTETIIANNYDYIVDYAIRMVKDKSLYPKKKFSNLQTAVRKMYGYILALSYNLNEICTYGDVMLKENDQILLSLKTDDISLLK